ncbi:LLM class flavin-dependent oxidoreductase [Dactylosporangium matsuzakiense]|uniref:Monooxygenase n=1 Tax=Dactylosporangium matsuzakiense TaxID=53360 RepID=A0A9W6KD55_9ACTN|nr:LLM class flavin-dependent oxidoreductase [Dactylosporangium matsuzakiense]GLK99287.1 monooxygenase [Dactylosporangium matsuzakiense]
MPFVLAVEIDGGGAHPAAWRTVVPPDALVGPRHLRHVAEVAERAGFTLVTIDDDLLPPEAGPGRIGAVERAGFVAAATSVLGVAPVVSTTYSEPFHVSTQLASVDHIASGRAGWVVGASARPEAAAAWGRATADPLQEAVDAVRVVRALWDSWEDDAVVRDVATGRYLDRDRLHYVDFTGATYSIKGPAIVPRPPQGQPVVIAPRGLVADAEVDVALVGGADVDAVRRAAAASGTPLAFAELEVALDTDTRDGAERVAQLDAYASWPSSGRLRYTGGPNGLTILLRDLAAAGLHGVRIHPLVLGEDLAVLSRFVVPALVRAGLVARPRPGTTLRATLGLPRPQSRFTATGGRA